MSDEILNNQNEELVDELVELTEEEEMETEGGAGSKSSNIRYCKTTTALYNKDLVKLKDLVPGTEVKVLVYSSHKPGQKGTGLLNPKSKNPMSKVRVVKTNEVGYIDYAKISNQRTPLSSTNSEKK